MIEKNHILLELSKFNQDHLLDFFDNATDQQQDQLLKDIQSICLTEVCDAFEKSNPKNATEQEAIDHLLEPLHPDIHQSVARTSPEELKRFRDIGRKLCFELPLLFFVS